MANLNIRVSDAERERLEQSAARHGQTLTAYVLSWLPDAYTRQDTEHTETTTRRNRGDRTP